MIEMLVTITIIGVIATLGLFGVKRMLSAAHKAQCVSNLHQWGMIFNTYISENNGRFPESEPTLSNGWVVSWQHNLYSLNNEIVRQVSVKNWRMGKGILGCPAHDGTPYGSDSTLRYYSYLYNYEIGKPPRSGQNMPWPPPININQLRSRHNLMVLVDSVNTPTPYSGFDYGKKDRIGFVHDGKYNALFADWHVESSSRPIEKNNTTPDI